VLQNKETLQDTDRRRFQWDPTFCTIHEDPTSRVHGPGELCIFPSLVETGVHCSAIIIFVSILTLLTTLMGHCASVERRGKNLSVFKTLIAKSSILVAGESTLPHFILLYSSRVSFCC